MRSRSFFSILAALSLVSWTLQVQAISTEALKQGIPSLAPMLEQVTPAVVSILVIKTVPSSGSFSYNFNGQQLPDELRRYFENLPGFGDNPQRQPFATGAGSGVIINARQGLVITNHHVVHDASRIMVQLSDGRSIEATLLGSDAGTDVALLKIEADNLLEIAFADIQSVQVGDYVVAIGNPFGIGQTVTSGIVSALGRAGLNNANYEDFIQTDAAINLGNSGGALVDMEGRLIGMNTAIISGNGGSNGIGFAVPGDMLQAVIEHLEQDGEVRRGMLGVTIADVTPDVIAALSVGVDKGAIVTSIVPGSAAEKAGIRVSDVIVSIDGLRVTGSRELRNTVGLKRQGQEVELVLYRDGEQKTLSARIGGMEGQPTVAVQSTGAALEFRGAQLRNLDSESGSGSSRGIEVLTVDPQSPAWSSGLRQGDVIVTVNRRSIADTEAFTNALEATRRFTALTVLREGQTVLLFVP